MAFHGIDRILQLESAKSITAERTVSADEEHFRDHFPNYAVYPGVLMLEGMVQSAGWLVRETEGFRQSQVYMSRCAQAKYSKLVRPSTVLKFHVECVGREGNQYELKGKVQQGESTVAAARFQLRSQKLEQPGIDLSDFESSLNAKSQKQFVTLTKTRG